MVLVNVDKKIKKNRIKIDKDDFGVFMMVITHLGLLVFAIWLLTSSVKDMNKISEYKQLYIGEKVIIDNDTLIIIDYPLFSDKVRLSNGLKVDTSFVIKTDAIKNYEN